MSRRRERSEPRSAVSGSSTASFCEHLLKSLEDGRDRLWRKPTKSPDKPLSIDSPQLIQGNEAGPTLKAARHAPWICSPGGGHRSHDDCAWVCIELIRGHNETRAVVLDLAAERRVQANQVNVTAGSRPWRYRHSQSSRSKRVGKGSSRRRSWRASDIARAASAQPVLGRRAPWTTIRPGSA